MYCVNPPPPSVRVTFLFEDSMIEQLKRISLNFV